MEEKNGKERGEGRIERERITERGSEEMSGNCKQMCERIRGESEHIKVNLYHVRV